MSGVRKFEQFLAYIGLQEYQDHLTNQFETLDELVDFVEDNGVDSFKFLPVVPSRRLSRHCAQIAIGFGPFGVWGSKVKPEQPPTFDFKQHLLETQALRPYANRLNELIGEDIFEMNDWMNLPKESFPDSILADVDRRNVTLLLHWLDNGQTESELCTDLRVKVCSFLAERGNVLCERMHEEWRNAVSDDSDDSNDS